MSALNPDDGLFDLVSSIDDERPVDWEAAEREAETEEDRATIRELKLLSEIARVYRDPDAVASADPVAHTSPLEETIPNRRWGQLRVLNEIGRGAFSTVYRALDRFDREVALKLLSLGPDAGHADRSRILREGRLLARLTHPNIVSVFGADEVDGQVGLWMQLIRGNTLEDDLKTRGPRGAHEATLIGLDLCRALAAVHSAGLLHRDIKAQNVMWESGGRTVLMDFGAGMDVARDAVRRTRAMAGTPLYLAPELFEHTPPTVASDIYSLGVLLYRIVSGEFPVDGATLDDIERAHARGDRMRLRDARADLPDGFVHVVERATATQPAQRYRSAGELEEALASLLPRRSPVPPPAHASTRYRAVAAVLVGSLAVVGLWAIAPWLKPGARTVGAEATESALAPTPIIPPAPQPYTVEAAFLRSTEAEETRLAHDARVAPGDDVLLTLKASRPVFAYVYNQDAKGRRYALYPLDEPGFATALAAGRTHRLPGVHEGKQRVWTVSSAGTREQFVIAVSPERDLTLEAWLRTLPKPTDTAAIEGASEPPVGTLRGVGGLAARPVRKGDEGPSPFPDALPLGTTPETVTGQWVRQLTLSNP